MNVRVLMLNSQSLKYFTMCLLVFLSASTSLEAIAASKTGKQVYLDTCYICHGNGRVSSSTWPIYNLKGKYDHESLSKRIRSGGATMPPITHISEDELAKVATFVLNDLANTKDFSRGSISAKKETSLKESEGFSSSLREFGKYSITEFGYSAGNNAVAESFFEKDNVKYLKKEDHPELKSALKHMPLMARKTNANQRVIYYGTQKGEVAAYNIDSKEILWKTQLPSQWKGKDLPNHLLYSTPVIDLDAKKIYGMTIGDGLDKYLNNFMVMDIESGTIQDLCPVSNSDYFSKTANAEKFKNHVHCKTAPALTEVDGKKSIYVGCSMRIEPQKFMYVNEEKPTGAVIAYRSNSQGEFKGCDIDVLPTSNIGDSGVYQSAGKIATLPDGDLLVATGNGPVDIAQGELGCSVVRMNPDLSVATTEHGRHLAHSLTPQGDMECWVRNKEYSVGGVSVVDLNGKRVAAAVNKLGTIAFFDPDTFTTDGNDLVEVRIGTNPVYGTPVGFEDSGGAIFVAAFGGSDALEEEIDYDDEHFEYSEFDHYLSVKPESDKKHLQYCAGYLSAKGSHPLVRYYSGPLKDDYAITVVGSDYEKQLTSNNKLMSSTLFGSRGDYYFPKDLWVPYKKEATLGYSVDKRFAKKVIKNNKHVPLELVVPPL